jgi:hypothetical protein
MATNANWTVIFDDKKIIKHNEVIKKEYEVDDDSFWNQSKFSNIWAIQHGTSVTADEVEYRDSTPHSSYADANIGDFSQFTSKWEETKLAEEQADWDGDNVDGETAAEKITRLGARPTS